MNFIVEVIGVIVLIEALTNILSKSELCNPIREFLFNRRESKFFKLAYSIVDCPYCLSVWISFLCVGMFYLYINNHLPSIFIWMAVCIIFHRTSNIFHFIIDRMDENHVFYDLKKGKE